MSFTRFFIIIEKKQVIQTDEHYLHLTFGTEEEREFLMEMLEPEMHEGRQTLQIHQEEELESVDDIEMFSNNMSRQQRRMTFLQKLYQALEGSNSD